MIEKNELFLEAKACHFVLAIIKLLDKVMPLNVF